MRRARLRVDPRDCFASLAMTPQMAVIARSGATKQSRRQAAFDGLLHTETVFGSRKAAGADIGSVGLGGHGDQRSPHCGAAGADPVLLAEKTERGLRER